MGADGRSSTHPDPAVINAPRARIDPELALVSMRDDDPRTRTTQELDPMDVHSWPIVLSGLERLGNWDPVYTLRLGMLQKIRGVLVAMCDPNAPADLVNEMRGLVEALAKMPWAVPPGEPR